MVTLVAYSCTFECYRTTLVVNKEHYIIVCVKMGVDYGLKYEYGTIPNSLGETICDGPFDYSKRKSNFTLKFV